ncbi:hypothetical protein VIPECLUMC02_00289 [Enterobacter phage vB_VIPECLUMC02]|nr:hypothetical protein VIPECLUMC02_00289 [Enterobacter phage vB_VIPECLUMC02]
MISIKAALHKDMKRQEKESRRKQKHKGKDYE